MRHSIAVHDPGTCDFARLAMHRALQVAMLPEDALAGQVAFAFGREIAVLLPALVLGQALMQGGLGKRRPGLFAP
ncbi:MAG: hypothetical protein PHI97_18795 [Desulfobulbus sp.]|nr:hypothetical protein [Desulfobulbus sp.]